MVLGFYLDALDEELVTLRSSTSTHVLPSTLKVDELEDVSQTSGSRTEMKERGYTVRQLLI